MRYICSNAVWGGALSPSPTNRVSDRLPSKALVNHVRVAAERRGRSKSSSDGAGGVVDVGVDEKDDGEGMVPSWFTPDVILGGIHVFRVHDETAQEATIRGLPKFLTDREAAGCVPVRVVVIDSIAFHYRVSEF